MEVVDEEEYCPSSTKAQRFTAASLADYKRPTLSHSFNLPTVHCAAQRSEFNTMAKHTTLLPAPACLDRNVFVSTRLGKLQ